MNCHVLCRGKKNKSYTLSDFLLLINDRFVLKDCFPRAMTQGQNTRKTTIRSIPHEFKWHNILEISEQIKYRNRMLQRIHVEPQRWLCETQSYYIDAYKRTMTQIDWHVTRSLTSLIYPTDARMTSTTLSSVLLTVTCIVTPSASARRALTNTS